MDFEDAIETTRLQYANTYPRHATLSPVFLSFGEYVQNPFMLKRAKVLNFLPAGVNIEVPFPRFASLVSCKFGQNER